MPGCTASAATVHGFKSPADLELFAHTFRDPQPAAISSPASSGTSTTSSTPTWNAAARLAPGQFPEALGSDLPPQGEAFLLERSRTEEEAGRKETALAAVEVLLQLAPRSLAAYDRLACLHYRKGDLERAVSLLDGWRQLAPRDHWPLVRQAIIEQQRGNAERRAEVINQALGLTRGPLRASIAFLGAKLALRESVKEWDKARRRPR